ncbi:MAG: UDP-N-acetylmuramate dehydrogenase [Alphaproteobacteria bacterium]|nr:UDP-N-acetylmuramate dehydrogenase [Alphaproteobacteria bacterium]
MSDGTFVDSQMNMQKNVSLKNKTWFGVGGNAEYYIEPNDAQELKQALQYAYQNQLAVTMLGAGSNVLIRDGGIDGLVIHLPKSFTNIEIHEDILICGAAASLMEMAKVAAKACISGFEFMVGIPGTLGGGFRTNAGAYGADLGKITVELVTIDHNGIIKKYYPKQENIFGYRSCALPSDEICLEAKLQGQKEATNQQILNQMQLYKEKRQSSQPQGVRTAGSTFKNSPDFSAWKLLDEAGLRGYTLNGAKFSEKHPNFLINTGTASAEDLENLISFAQEKVLQKTGIKLECEIKILGKDSI